VLLFYNLSVPKEEEEEEEGLEYSSVRKYNKI